MGPLSNESTDALDARFRAVMDAAPVMIWVSVPDQSRIWFNRPWLDFTGRSMEQELGDGWAQGVHPDDLDRCLQTYFEHFDARRPLRMQYRLRRHDGAYRWIDDAGIPRHAEDGRFLGYIGSCADIHSADELIAQRTAELVAQERRLKGVDRDDGVAHDLNNLLSIIIGNLENAQRHISALNVPALSLKRLIGNAMRGAQRAATLTERLLAFSHRLPLDPKPRDVSELAGRGEGPPPVDPDRKREKKPRSSERG
jgi:PAS domain S-box-containing protein